MATAEPDFLIRLRPLPADTPGVLRLRHALKLLLRAYRLKCVEAQTLRPDGEVVNVEVNDHGA
jgi:hypothetical protein